MEIGRRPSGIASERREDLAKVQAILCEDVSAWDWFLRGFSDRILALAVKWCHARYPNRACRVCSPNCDGDCDELHDGYLFILETIKKRILRKYKGGCRLATFLNPLFERSPARNGSVYDYVKLFADYVRKKRGRPRPPRSIQGLSESDRKIFVCIRWGWDDSQIAGRLTLSAEAVSQSRQRIEAALKAKGPDEYWRWIVAPSVIEVPLSGIRADDGSGEGEALATDPADPRLDPEQISCAREVLERLSRDERIVLRLICQDGMTAAEAARAVGCERRRIYSIIERIRSVVLQNRSGRNGPTRCPS